MYKIFSLLTISMALNGLLVSNVTAKDKNEVLNPFGDPKAQNGEVVNERGGEVGNPVLENKFKGSPEDFYFGPELLKACTVEQTKRFNHKSECVEHFSGMYISKYISEQIIKECFNDGRDTGAKIECAKDFDGKAYPKEAQKLCKGLSVSACASMFKDSIVQYPLAPKKELLDEVQQNIASGNYARVKVLMDVLLSKEKYVASVDKCARPASSLEVSDTRMEKLKQDVEQIEKKSRTSDK